MFRPKPKDPLLLIEDLRKLNDSLTRDNKLLEHRITKLERVVSQLLTKSRTVNITNKIIKENLRSISSQLASINIKSRHKKL